jgi:beta-lactam-binding protein with PASTA domain
MKRVVFALALVAAALVSRPLKVSTQTDPALVGQWSGVRTWPAIAVHSHLLTSGKVLTWEEGSQATIWDPATNLFTAVPNPWVDLLCSGHTFLADGRLLTLGGWDRSGTGLGLNEADIFEPNIQAWIRARPMAFKRWYPTATNLPNGKVIVVSGARNSLTDIVNVPELYDPATDTWTSLTAATRAIPMYPFLFVLPDGRLISVGNSEVPSATQALNLNTLTWTVIDSRSLQGGAAVMYQPGKFMKAGTSADSGDSGLSGSTAFTLDMSEAAPLWKPTGSMSFPRSFHNLTTLPDGSVLVTGGGTDRSAFISTNGVLAAELWSPSNGTWTTLASAARARLYHSTANLLADGRVLVAGGGADSGVQDEVNAEIYSPPYLFKGSRPTISSTPSTLSYGTNFTVATPDAASIASVALISPGSVTHAFNHNQRFMNLAFSVTPSGLNVAAPANANLAPPGYYMLFIVNGNGVPSVATFVNFPVGAAPVVVAVPNVVNTTQAAATTAIATAGLTVGAITTATSTTVASGSVISQNPAAGTQVATGSAVSLVVSSGSGLITVPNVVNSPQAAATAAITGTGLTVGTVTTASSATVLAGSVISQNPIGGAQLAPGTAVALVVSSGPGVALAVDTTVFVDGKGTVATPPFSTAAAGELLVAFVSSDGPTTSAQTATVTGAGLTWTLKRRANTQFGTSEIWTAAAATSLVNVTVAAQQLTGGFDQSLTIVAFRGAGGTGAVAAANALTGASAVSLTTTRAGSLVYGVGNDWDRAIARTLGTGQTMVHQWVDSAVGDTFWVQSRTAAVAASGTLTTLNATAPTTDRWNFAAIEILNSTAPQVATPNVVGQTQAAATAAITGAGLTLGTVTTASSTTVPSGSVISQNPAAGTQVVTGSAVALVVSSGLPQVATPNVVGQTQAAATAAITGAGLTLGTVTTASSTTVPSGSVISQNPAAGTQVVTGSAVALVVSSGLPQVATPNVVGQTQAAATAAITGAGLTLGTVTTASSTTVPTGSVISQNPAAGTQVVTGSAVTLVVSSGLPRVATPNVVGQTQAAATAAITGAGLTLGTVTTASSTTVPSGTVMSQNPAAGTQVVTGSAVALVVSTGLPEVTTPNVVGQTQAAATAAITGGGLTLGTVTTASSTTVPAGSVISQTPAAGTQVATGTAVSLAVSSGLPQVATPNVAGQTQAAATAAITGAGLTLGTVTTALSTTVPAGSVVSQTPAAGTQVVTGSAVALVISLGAPTSSSLAVDTVVSIDARGSVVTPPITTTSANELLVAFVSSDGPSTAPQTLAVSGAGLTWTLKQRANTQYGASEIWTAFAPTPLTAAAVISTQPICCFDQSLTVVAFRGAAGTGASVSGGADTGLPNVSLTTTRAGSLVYGVGNDWTSAEPRSLGRNQVMVHEWVDVGMGTLWVQALAAPVSDGGIAATIDDVAPTTDRWNLAAIEILDANTPATIAVPDVLNSTHSAATSAITGAGLTLGAVTTGPSATVAAGLVISQAPDAGMHVASGSAVALVISSGATPVATPNVVGLTQTAATSAITAEGLTVGTVTTASSTTAPAGSIISQSPVAGTQVLFGSAVSLVVSTGAPIALSVDKVVFSDGAGTRTTPAFSTTRAGELLVAFASAAGPTSTSIKQTLTVSGAGLSWTLVRRSNGQFGSSEVWSAMAPGILTSATVTATSSITGFDQSLTVVAFMGAAGTGATGAASASTGPTTVSLFTTAPGSLVYGVANDSARSALRTLGANQTMTHQWLDSSANQTFWVQSITSPVANAGTIATINDTAPTSDRWNVASVEILTGSTTPPLTVPNVVGLTQAAATSAITNAGLTLGLVTISPSTTVPQGSVVSQNPAAGAQIDAGSAVTLVVSSGPPLVVVPDVEGSTQDQATIAIEGAGLTIGVVSTVTSTTVPADQVITQSPVAGTLATPGTAVTLTVSSGPPMSLSVDRVVISEGVGTRVTAPFTTAGPDEVLVAFVSSDGPNTTVRQSATVSGAGLSWTLVRRANAQFGTAEIWTATATSQLVNATVTATQTVTANYDQQLLVVAFRGAAGVGAAVAGGGNNTAPSVSLTTTQDGSMVYGVGFDPERATARTLGSGQTMIRQLLDNNDKLTFWVQARSTATANAGTTVTINDTAPDVDRWNLAAVEIVPR